MSKYKKDESAESPSFGIEEVGNVRVIENECVGCLFELDGRCRRMPMQIDGGSWSFPPATSGCGEFKSRS
jgi:hypothetical protein